MTDNSVMYPPQLEIFLNIFEFSKVLTYNLLVNSLGVRLLGYEVFIVDITFRFTCGELDRY